jgi:hypothetical protein
MCRVGILCPRGYGILWFELIKREKKNRDKNKREISVITAFGIS